MHDNGKAAVVLAIRGEIHEDMGDLIGALDCERRSLQTGGNRADPQNVATTLNDLGNLYDELGQYELALETYRRALALYRQEKSDRDVASCLCNMGLVCGHMGQADRGLGYLQDSVELRRRLHDEAGQASNYNNIGLLYDIIGQDDKALDYYRRALEIKQRGDDPASIARSLNNIGNIYQQQGRYREAMDYDRCALRIKRTLKNPLSLANTIDNLAGVALASGQVTAALQGYKQTLELRRRNHAGLQDIADAIENIGDVRLRQRKYSLALRAYRRALQIRSHLVNGVNLVNCLCALGNAYAIHGRSRQAETYYARAVRVYEALSAHLSDGDQYGSLQMATHNLYAQYARILSRRRAPLRGLLMAERGRAQGLAKQAAWNRLDFDRLLSRDDAQRLVAAAGTLDRASRARQAGEQQEVPGEPAAIVQFRTQQAEARLRYQQAVHDDALVRQSLRARYPQYRQVEGHRPATKADLADLIRRHPDTLYLEYVVVDDDTTLLYTLSARSGLRLFTLALGEKTLQPLVTRWRAELTEQRLAFVARSRRLERRDATTLYRALLGPVAAAGLFPADGTRPQTAPSRAHGRKAASLPGHIVFVPDGPICDLPFVALCDVRGRRLVTTYAVSQAISLGILCWSDIIAAPQQSLLCVADPFPSGDGGQPHGGQPHSGGQAVTSLEVFRPLRFARQEANAIASLFPGATVLAGNRARVADVKSRIEQYGMLHFATHGVLDARNGMQSALVLDADRGAGYALISAREIADMRLKARLAVLSACETARGQRSGGEGLLGLAWAFRAAGCPAVMASQWRVDDQATARLMTAFYTCLRNGLTKDAALRRAMLQVAANAQTADPYYWAGFVLTGDSTSIHR